MLVVARTIGLMTLRVRTLTQAVLPLERALSKAGFNSSGFSTNSPCPPIPSNMVWNGISLKSVAPCRWRGQRSGARRRARAKSGSTGSEITRGDGPGEDVDGEVFGLGETSGTRELRVCGGFPTGEGKFLGRALNEPERIAILAYGLEDSERIDEFGLYGDGCEPRGTVCAGLFTAMLQQGDEGSLVAGGKGVDGDGFHGQQVWA